MRSESTRDQLLLIAAVTLAAVFLYGAIPYGEEPYSGMDLRYYRAMADEAPGLADGIPKPFAYRILGPWLAGVLPLPEPAAFYALNSLISLLVPTAFFLLLVRTGAGGWPAALATILFVLNKHLFGISCWDFFQVKDTLSLLFLLLSFHSMYSGKRILFSISLILGALAGELAVVMIPVLFCYLWEKGGPGSRWRELILTALPAAAAFAALRIFIPSSGGLSLWEALGIYGGKARYPLVWYGLLVNPFIPLAFLPAVFFRETLRFAREKPHMLVYFLLILFSAFFGSNNERLMAPAFIPFYMLMARIFGKELSGSQGSAAAAAAAIAAAGILSFLHHTVARYPLPSRSVTVALSGGSLAAITLLSLLWRLRSRRARVNVGNIW